MFLSDRLVEVREVGLSNIGLLPDGFYNITGGQESLVFRQKYQENNDLWTLNSVMKLEKKNIIMDWKA